MTKFEPHIRLYGYHRGGTTSERHTYTGEYDLASDRIESAINGAHETVAQWLAKWDAMSNPPRSFRVELFLTVIFVDGREVRKLIRSFKLRSPEKVFAYVDRHSTRIFEKFAKLE